MATAGRPLTGKSEERIERLVRFIERNGHIEWWHVQKMLDLTERNAIIWRDRARREYARRRAPVPASTLRLAASTARLSLATGALAKGVNHAV